MKNGAIYPVIVLLFCGVIIVPVSMAANGSALHNSVEQALKYSPELRSLNHDSDAIGHDLRQSRSNYRPSIDLIIGYGIDQHSDNTTRQAGAHPSDSDWDSRNDATLRLTQKLYDGGETGQQVSIQKAALNSANYRIKAAAQSVALNAIIAHLEVFRQRQLVALALKNIKFHEDIHQLLAEREQAGAGNIADVTQVQARMARAQSTMHSSRADLSGAIARYVSETGVSPEKLAYAGVPTMSPPTLEAVLQQTEQQNPDLLALMAELDAANSRLMLARTKYRPRLDLELSSRYNNGLEGNPSWEATNTAALFLRWNLYKGGNDQAGVKAALSRKHLSRSQRTAKWVELKDSISATWATRLAFQGQKEAFRDAVDFSRKTFDAYLNQFSVSQRTLLDVLTAENDFFQSAVQLVDVAINETIATCRLLALMGTLTVPRCENGCEDADDFQRLTQSMKFPLVLNMFSPPGQERAANMDYEPVGKTPTVEHASIVDAIPGLENSLIDPGAAKSTQFQTVEIGPHIHQRELRHTREALEDMGLSAKQKIASGPVTMFRLLEGVYPQDQATQRLADLKKEIDSAFVLRQEGGIGLYAGSFRSAAHAQRFKDEMGRRQIALEIVEQEVKMEGTMLIVEQIERRIAASIAQRVSRVEPKATIIIHSF